MKGGIYSNERCPVCGGAFRDFGGALCCPAHPKQRATRFVVRFGGLTKNFRSYGEAARFLTGVRFKTDEATFDERDYRKDNPLGFSNQAESWLTYKKDEVRRHSFRSINNHMDKARAFFGNLNVKEIRKAHLQDFIKSLDLHDKTKHNVLSTVHQFLTWVYDREEIPDFPKFPRINYELGYRKTVDKETQLRILDEVKRIAPYRVWLAIHLLCRYISIRPGELRSLTWGNVDEAGYLYIPHPKERRLKAVPILRDDVDMVLRAKSREAPEMPNVRVFGFGVNLLYRTWRRCCENVGVRGVDLYGGTRHSSARALRQWRTPEEIRRATMHTTNKAFDRYFTMEADDLRSIYSDTGKVVNFNNGLITQNGASKK